MNSENELGLDSHDKDATPDANLGVLELAHSFIELTNQHLFITGKAGSGKTYFLNEQSRKTTKKHVVIAPTGIAAVNAGGVTINSLFQIPPGTYIPDRNNGAAGVFNIADLVNNLNYTQSKKKFFQELELIFIDEVSMLRSDQLSLMDAILKKVRNNTAAYGGVQVVFIGDLFQLPPVLPADLAKLYSRYYASEFFFDADVVKSNPAYQLELPFVHRQSDVGFVNLLNQVRNGRLTAADLERLNERVINPVSDKFITYITSHVEDAVKINDVKLLQLPEHERVYSAITTGVFEDAAISAERNLKLKKGAQVMLIRNDTKSLRDYHNGKTGEVIQLMDDVIVLRFEDGKELNIERSTWQSFKHGTESGILEIVGELKQFPIKLSWAVTIHKSQGLTFDRAVIDAAKSFAPGQTYVALSRVKSFHGLFLTSKLTADSIRVDSRITKFLQPSNLQHLSDELTQSKTLFFLSHVLAKFDVAKERAEILLINNKPNTYKQRIDTKILLLLQDLDQALEKLQNVHKRFLNEIQEKFKAQIDVSQLSDRIGKAKIYFINILSTLVADMDKDSMNRNDLSAELVASLKSSIHRRMESIQHVDTLVTLFSTDGIDTAIRNSRSQSNLAPDEAEVSTEKTTKKKSNKTVGHTTDLFISGKTIREIAILKNVSEGRVENHLLEAVENGMLHANSILHNDDLKIIKSTIRELGAELADLKEHFGDKYTFFQLRLGIVDEKFRD